MVNGERLTVKRKRWVLPKHGHIFNHVPGIFPAGKGRTSTYPYYRTSLQIFKDKLQNNDNSLFLTKFTEKYNKFFTLFHNYISNKI